MEILAFDVGGSSIKFSVMTADGEILTKGSVDTPDNLDDFYNELIQVKESLAVKYKLIGAAFSLPGAVDDAAGIIGGTSALPYIHDFPIKRALGEKLFLPVAMENDANCAAWAEHEIGASKGCKTSVMLTLGTGVGGGIIIDHKLFKGKSGAAGEMHFKMYPDKRRKCTCGSWDCFEAYASGTALKVDAEEMLNNPKVTTYDVMDGVKNGDKKMTEIFNRWINDITIGVNGLTNLFDPDCIVLSGSMAQFVDAKKMEEAVNCDIVTSPTSIRIATAGNYSGMIGAALLAFESEAK